MKTPEKQVGEQLFDLLCKEILNNEWEKIGYLNYKRRPDRKAVLDGSGSPVRWILKYDWEKRFSNFTYRQNRRLTKLLKRSAEREEQMKEAAGAKELLILLDPDAEARAAANEIKTWIRSK